MVLENYNKGKTALLGAAKVMVSPTEVDLNPDMIVQQQPQATKHGDQRKNASIKSVTKMTFVYFRDEAYLLHPILYSIGAIFNSGKCLRFSEFWNVDNAGWAYMYCPSIVAMEKVVLPCYIQGSVKCTLRSDFQGSAIMVYILLLKINSDNFLWP
eukprot:g40370.t1